MPAPAVGPYPIANDILNSARVRLNDTLKSLYPSSGKILDETTAFSQQALNNGLRRMQNQLADEGVSRFKGEIVITGIPPTRNFDPASKQSISWFQFFDGFNFQAKPVLPSNLIYPLWMSERWSVSPGGGQNVYPFPDVNRPNMTLMIDGMQTRTKYQWNGQWEWREDTIFFPGSTQMMDFRIGFRTYLPDITDVGVTRWWEQPVQIINCNDAASKWLCYEFATARAVDGDASEQMAVIAAGFKAEAIEATKYLVNPDAMREERTNTRRVPYGGGRGNRGWYGR
jgi:hypothetical protein